MQVLHLDDDTLIERLQASGLPPFAARITASLGAAARQGFLADLSDTVHNLTGTPPSTLEAVIA